MRTYWTAKGVGWDNLPRRILQLLRVRSGWLAAKLKPENFTDSAYAGELLKPVDWRNVASRMPFKIPSRETLGKIVTDHLWRFRVERIAEKAHSREFMYFSNWFAKPRDFNHDPVNDVHWPVGEHWLRGDTLGGTDIKLLWEPNRFSVGYFLGRHYVRSGDESVAELFWRLVDDWVEQNPPELTRNWSCGQEAAFRMMAILFGTVCTLDSQAARPERLNRVAMLAWQTARHIAVNINYARSQGNNHAISEALWLITAGVVFGENFAPASRWLSDGLDIMCREIRRQVMDDGSYAQHSMNYHRLVMDDLPWTFGILRAGGIVVPDVMREKFEKLTCWIEEMADENTGRVPNYGPNDGAKVLPLSCCDYVDYRPTIQAAWYEVFGKSRYHAGCWNEKKLWLYGEESLDAPKSDVKKTAAFNAASGGYYVMRGRTSMAFTRCHTYTRRPNQNDMLHVDLWHEGKNILRDAGSFSYNAPEPWSGYFSSTAAHNTVTVNGENQMVRGPRHLWFRWTKSRLLEWFVSDDGSIGFFSGEHYGYSRFGATHRRSILRIGDGYVILDEIIGRRKEMKTELNWRLISDDWQAGFTGGGLRVVCPEATITVFAETGFDVSFDESGDAGPSGWESLYYGQKSPCPYIRVAGSSKAGTTKFVTIVSTGSTEMFPAMLDAMKTDAAVAMRHITEKFVDDVRHLTGMEMN